MESFILDIPYRQHQTKAEVTITQRSDHMQITVSPVDSKLRAHIGTQVFHKFPGKPLQAAFPSENPESDEYTQAANEVVMVYLGKNRK